MRIPLILLSVLLVINLAVDYYLYRIAKKRCKSNIPSSLQYISSILLYIYIIITICLPRRSGSEQSLITIMWLLFIYFSVYIPKYLFVIIDIIASIPCLFRSKRLSILSLVGGVIAILIFLLMWWGALINRFRINVEEINLVYPELPAEFNGFKILQFSDFHVGTYGYDPTYVEKVVNKINSLEADVIFFTGDIVNRKTAEIEPFVTALSKLDAPYGVYAVLGNHDYGDYSDWPSKESKVRNMSELYAYNKKMGWKLLLNEMDWIKRGNDSIAIIGVENIGDPPFPVYGDLKASYSNINDDNFKILLSHNPAHWVVEISDIDSIRVPLTLSGHTHAMQIELFGLSPAVFRYPTWGGLYENKSKNKKLYVNIGLGTVGIPMRIGATPELTLITLEKKEINK